MKAEVKQLLSELESRAPWALFGYSQEIRSAMSGSRKAEALAIIDGASEKIPRPSPSSKRGRLIAFEHGALQHRGEPLLAGILAYGVPESADARAIAFLANAERLAIEERAAVLESDRELRARRLPAVRRLRDAITIDEPSAIGLLANQRIAVIARTLELRARSRDHAGVVRFATR